MDIEFTTQIFKEGRVFVAYTRELDLSSCGGTQLKASRNLKEVVRLFLEEADSIGTLDQVLEEAGYSERNETLYGPRLVATERVRITLPPEHAKA